jgi:hypothetical protein
MVETTGIATRLNRFSCTGHIGFCMVLDPRAVLYIYNHIPECTHGQIL